jgi:Tol biopolymer transport system component
MRKALLILSIALILVAGCSQPTPPIPTATNTAVPTHTPTTPPTATNTPAPTATPSLTPTVSPSTTATSAPTPFGGGGTIVFASNREGTYDIYSMNPDGYEQTRLTDLPTDEFFPHLSPNGERLALWASDQSATPMVAEVRINTLDDSAEPFVFKPALGWPAWSPDSSTIAMVVVNMEQESGMDIITFNPRSFKMQMLATTPGDDMSPAWSPDGKTIAFTSDRGGLPQIYLMDSNGGNPRKLFDEAMIGLEPAWSPDGTQIAFVSGDDTNTQIHVTNMDGTDIRQVTNAPGYNENPTWSPDGTMIAFWSDRDGNREIYVINVYGGGLTRLTDNDFSDENPSWFQ